MAVRRKMTSKASISWLCALALLFGAAEAFPGVDPTGNKRARAEGVKRSTILFFGALLLLLLLMRFSMLCSTCKRVRSARIKESRAALTSETVRRAMPSRSSGESGCWLRIAFVSEGASATLDETSLPGVLPREPSLCDLFQTRCDLMTHDA